MERVCVYIQGICMHMNFERRMNVELREEDGF